jgi:hypothetical protein
MSRPVSDPTDQYAKNLPSGDQDVGVKIRLGPETTVSSLPLPSADFTAIARASLAAVKATRFPSGDQIGELLRCSNVKRVSVR